MLIRLVVIIASWPPRSPPRPARLFVVPPFDFIIPLDDQTPVLFVGWAFLVAKDCRWTATLLASPGPFTAPCDGLTVGIGTNRPQEELTPLWLTVESPGGTGGSGRRLAGEPNDPRRRYRDLRAPARPAGAAPAHAGRCRRSCACGISSSCISSRGCSGRVLISPRRRSRRRLLLVSAPVAGLGLARWWKQRGREA